MGNAVDAFIAAACVPLDADHGSGTLSEAEEIAAANPGATERTVHAAAAAGNAAAVRRFIALDRANATVKGGPDGWDALTCLCFSRYLRLDAARSAAFVDAATALLDAGASANTGWFELRHQPNPEWESAIYGAAGVARHPELTSLLLERGADPNDNETPYHAPETYDNRALAVLVDSGTLSDESLNMILLRKTDWHDHDAIKWLLERGVDPNRMTRWGKTALHNAILSDNALAIVDLLLDYGADPNVVASQPSRSAQLSPGRSATAMAARRGRGDVLTSLARRGIAIELEGVDRLVAACARKDRAEVTAMAHGSPLLVEELRAMGGTLLAEFAGVDNSEGVGLLLDLGVDIATPYDGDGYFGIPTGSLAIHVAAWKASHATVKLLVARGSPIDRPDANGRTPLALAVRACVDSYWTALRSPESVAALLAAGASAAGIQLPTGFDAIDGLLTRARRD